MSQHLFRDLGERAFRRLNAAFGWLPIASSAYQDWPTLRARVSRHHAAGAKVPRAP